MIKSLYCLKQANKFDEVDSLTTTTTKGDLELWPVEIKYQQVVRTITKNSTSPLTRI